MKFKHFDAHTRTQFPAYDNDRDAVIDCALKEGIGIINVGSEKGTSIDAVKLAHKYNNGVYATIGLHPTDSEEGFDYEEFIIRGCCCHDIRCKRKFCNDLL